MAHAWGTTRHLARTSRLEAHASAARRRPQVATEVAGCPRSARGGMRTFRRTHEGKAQGRRCVRARAGVAVAIATVQEEAAQSEGSIRLEPLEPLFYYLGRKWGLRAYGVEFKEFVRDDSGSLGSEADEGEDELASIEDVPEGRMAKGVGVYAAQDIDTTGGAKILLEIPMPLMVSVSRDPPWMFYPNIVPLGHPIFDAINATHPEEDWDLRLACLLLLAQSQGGPSGGAGPPWASAGVEQMAGELQPAGLGLQGGPHMFSEYRDFMPPMEDCPALLLASEEELRELQDPELEADIRAEQERVRRFWEAHWGEGANPPRALAKLAASEKHLRWAVAQAKYRGVLLHAPMGVVEQDGHMLIPYADMLNHSFSPNCTLFWRQIDRVIEVRALPGQIIEAGEELTLNYALKGATNRELMRSHGFSMTKNPWERAELSGQHRIHRDCFLSAFDVVGFPGDYEFSDAADDGDGDPWQDETVIAAAGCLPMWSDGAVPAVPSEEIRAARGLQAECQALLAQFPSGVEEDLALLRAEADARPATWVLALKYRADRKLFLRRLIDVLEMYMERLLL